MLQWDKLYSMQYELDTFIEREKKLGEESLVAKKIVALLVEVGELANETRCFKFWSDKGPSERSVILEEYVDGIHFLLSLGLETNLRYSSNHNEQPITNLTEQFQKLFGCIHRFAEHPSQSNYDQMWDVYLCLGESLEFSEMDIMNAYLEKNEVNVNRQKEGY
ncbi:dUTP diphosphatase [Jeotgalibacillus marinus]|uniref:dUTP diphosphatase n=1 Tax=Jeotgalibacillus marinus TaxID=86667 RepID=A0ABV3Q0K0_9BACL